MPDYPKEQLWELYEQLPEDLQKATFSEKIGQIIQDICNKNGVADNDLIFNITKNVGYVFLGLLAPDDFLKILKTEIKIEKNKAEQIYLEITKSVFSPLRKSLENLYETKIGAKKTTSEEKPKPKAKKDSYREIIN